MLIVSCVIFGFCCGSVAAHLVHLFSEMYAKKQRMHCPLLLKGTNRLIVHGRRNSILRGRLAKHEIPEFSLVGPSVRMEALKQKIKYIEHTSPVTRLLPYFTAK